MVVSGLDVARTSTRLGEEDFAVPQLAISSIVSTLEENVQELRVLLTNHLCLAVRSVINHEFMK
jgi:hypothetical protein